MRRLSSIAIFLAATVSVLASDAPAQEGPAEEIGERIDRGLEQLSREVREKWGQIRQSIDELGVQGRVYGRLRWDKALTAASINIEVQERDKVVLTGVVANEKSRRKAVRLARNTVGVGEVVDRLRIEAPDADVAKPAEK